MKLRFIRGYTCEHTQVKNIPHRILTATVYHRILQNAVVASSLDTVYKLLWEHLSICKIALAISAAIPIAWCKSFSYSQCWSPLFWGLIDHLHFIIHPCGGATCATHSKVLFAKRTHPRMGHSSFCWDWYAYRVNYASFEIVFLWDCVMQKIATRKMPFH